MNYGEKLAKELEELKKNPKLGQSLLLVKEEIAKRSPETVKKSTLKGYIIFYKSPKEKNWLILKSKDKRPISTKARAEKEIRKLVVKHQRLIRVFKSEEVSIKVEFGF